MKSSVFLLFKVQLFEQFKLNGLVGKNHSNKRGRSVLLVAAWVFVGGILATYSYFISMGLCMVELSGLVPAYGLTIASIIILFFTTLKANGVLFAKKDYEIIMSLPVKTSAIISSRFLMMYVMNLAGAAIIMLPMCIAYAQFAPRDSRSIFFFPIWILGIITAPLFPTTLASIIGGFISWCASKFRHSNALASVISLVLIVGVLGLSFSISTMQGGDVSVDAISGLSASVGASLNKIYPLNALFTGAVVDNNLVSLGGFMLFSVGWYALFLMLLSSKYKAINTALFTHSAMKNFKLLQLKSASPVKAIYKKELKRFLGCAPYLINVSVGVIMLIVLSVAVQFVSPQALVGEIAIPNLEQIILRFLPFAMCALLGTSCTTFISLSLEGKNLWQIKSLPISAKSIFDGKILVNLTLLIPASLIGSTLLSLRFADGVLSVLSMFIVPLSYCFFVAVWGMFIDTKLCRFDWATEVALVKQSVNSMLGLLGAAAIGLLPIVLVLLLKNVSSYVIAFACIVVYTAVTLLMYRAVCRTKLELIG